MTEQDETTLDEIQREHRQKAKVDLLQFLVTAPHPFLASELAERFKTDGQTILGLVEEMAKEGRVFSFAERGILLLKEFLPTHDSVKIDGSEIVEHRFGSIADTHLASKYARADVLSALYDYYEANGIKMVYLMGNMIDGECRFNKHDLYAHGIEDQTDYFIANFPQRPGVTTKYITGDDHEGWYIQREGINIGDYLEKKAAAAGRSDLRFVGHMEHNISLERNGGKSTLRLIHAGGGTAYAISYTDQKYVESLQGGEKPNVVLVGHHHKWNMGYPREVHTFQVGCIQDQTPFMRKKRIQAMVGGAVVTMKQEASGVIRSCCGEWIPFYDRSFYADDKLWKYRWK